MATYQELYDLRQDGELIDKIAIAAAVTAQGLIDGATPTADEITWSAACLNDPRSKSSQLINYVLAANKGASVATIQSATDATIQTSVDAAVNALIAGGAV